MNASCPIAPPRPPSPPAPLCSERGLLLPTLFVIGSMKAGSTTIWAHAVEHAKPYITAGSPTDKGAISRKEKDFFGDPSMYRRGRRWYEKIWPTCPRQRPGLASDTLIGIDATPAYHVFHGAPQNMAQFYGPVRLPQLRLVWVLREPVSKFWSYYWEIEIYGNLPGFEDFTRPKLARAQECLRRDPASPLWPPSLPPPYTNCAPHLDHGLYEPHLRRWLQFFEASQLLLVSFRHFTSVCWATHASNAALLTQAMHGCRMLHRVPLHANLGVGWRMLATLR